MLGGFEKILLAVLVIVLMLGMGATIDLARLREVLKRPKGVLIGLCSQFGWMPLVAFGLAKVFALPDELALGLLIVGCTPGGTTSNLFAYLAKGDVALSVAMTTVSTLVAIVAMPALLLAYGRVFTPADFELPIGDLIKTLVVVVVPVAIGIVVRRKSLRAASIMEKLGSYSGIAVLLLLVVSSIVKNQAIFGQIPGGAYIAAGALGVVGVTLGYLSARVFGLPKAERRAVALETGIQNSPLAIAVVVATFPESLQDRMLWVPMLYALMVLVSASVISGLFAMSDRGEALNSDPQSE